MKTFKRYLQNLDEEAIAGNFELRTIWARDNFDRFKKKAIAGDLLNASGKKKFPPLSAQGQKELIPFLDSLEQDEPEGKKKQFPNPIANSSFISKIYQPSNQRYKSFKIEIGTCSPCFLI